MEVISTQKYIHTSPRKIRLVVDMVRKMTPGKALGVLQFTQKEAAKNVSAAIKTALANAKQKGLDEDKITFKTLEVNEGPTMKRIRAGTRGRAKPYQRRMSHLKIVLIDDLRIENAKLRVNNKKGGKQTKVVLDDLAKSAKLKSKAKTKSV